LHAYLLAPSESDGFDAVGPELSAPVLVAFM
jgi:hypothetical protein